MSTIDSKYAELCGERGFLGKPVMDETGCPDGIGRFRRYEYGSIYWHPLTGACEVHGPILAKWASLGGEMSFLGYPKTDEHALSVINGRYSQFQGGTILWFPPSVKTIEVRGTIRIKLAATDKDRDFHAFWSRMQVRFRQRLLL